MTLTCHKCKASLLSSDAVHLWDGKDYCRNCVEAAGLGSADCATHTKSLIVFDDAFSHRTAAIKLAVYAAICAVPFLFAFTVASIDLFSEGKLTFAEAIVFPPLLAVGSISLVFLLFFGVNAVVGPSRRQLVLSEGLVTYTRGDETCMSGQWEDFYFRIFAWNGELRLPWRTPILFVEYRKEGFLARRRATLALTPEMHRRWKALIVLES